MSIKKRRTRKRIILRVLLTVAIIVAAGWVLLFQVFVVKNVQVEGNELYSDARIEKAILNDKYSWSSLYVFLKYRLKEAEPIPFIDTMEVSLKSPQTICIDVFEKGVIGYVYVESMEQNAYFDKDGIVTELSADVIDGVTEIKGLTVDKVKLYQKLPLSNESILDTLLGVSQIMAKYEVVPDEVSVDDAGDVWLSFDKIRVNLGGNTYLNEKIYRLKEKLLPEITGWSGVLRLDTWTPTTKNVHFSPDEGEEIPVGEEDSDTGAGEADSGEE